MKADDYKPARFRTAWSLKVLYISNFVLRCGFGIVLLAFPFYVPGADDHQKLLNVAIVAIPYPLAEMLTANHFGILSDKIGRKRIIVLGSFLASAMVSIYVFSNNVALLAVVHGIHGIGAAATVAPSIAMIADYANEKDRGRQMGLYDYSTFSGYIIGVVIGGLLLSSYGDNARPSFIIVAVMLIISALLLWKFLVEGKPKCATGEGKKTLVHFGDIKKALSAEGMKVVFPIWLIISTLMGLAITYLPRIMSSEGFETSTISLGFAGAGVVLGLLQPWWGWVSDKVGRIPVMAYGIMSMFGIILMLNLFPSQIRAFEPWALGLLGLAGLGVGAFLPAALAFMADSSSKDSYGATMGLYSFALGFGFFIGEFAGLVIIATSGVISEEAAFSNSVRGLLYFCAVLVGMAVTIMTAYIISRKRNKAKNK